MNKEKRKRILIVEDNQPCLLLLNDVLEACGYLFFNDRTRLLVSYELAKVW
jgi:CheY-like chemotaxis protein